MSIRSIRRQATNPLAAPGTPSTAPIYVDSDDNKLKMIPAGSGTTEVEVADVSSTQTFTNKTLTSPTITSPTISSPNITGQTVSETTATRVVTSADAGKTVVLNRAGGVTVTLPAATGTGNRFRYVVGTALSAASHVIQVANGTDVMHGNAFVAADDSSGAIKGWSTADTGTTATESDTITLDGSTKSGYPGTEIIVEDIATNVFAVFIRGKATGTEATPFSAAV